MKPITLTLARYFFVLLLSSPVTATPLDTALATLTESNRSAAQLENALRLSSRLSASEQWVMANQLRLRLAAVQMLQGNYPQARHTLRDIDSTSSAAIHASLLMAESYRLTNDPDTARDWFLRTAHHYPYRTATLEGLISAAGHEQQRNNQLAVALYSEITQQTRFALEQLNHLPQPDQMDPRVILFPSTLHNGVRQALLQRTLHHPRHDFLNQSTQLQKAITALLAIHKRHQTLEAELNKVSELLAQHQQQRNLLEQQLTAGKQHRQSLTQQLVANDFSPGQIKIRKTISRLRNQHTRVQSQLVFIDQSLQSLPKIADRLEQQLKNMNKRAHKLLNSSYTQVVLVLEDSVNRYRSRLTELMAEAMLKRSELLLISKGQH